MSNIKAKIIFFEYCFSRLTFHFKSCERQTKEGNVIFKRLIRRSLGRAHDGDGPGSFGHPERRETQIETLGAVKTSTHSRAQKIESSATFLFACLLFLQGNKSNDKFINSSILLFVAPFHINISTASTR